MTEKQVIDVLVTRIALIAASTDGRSDIIIGLITDSDIDIMLKLSPYTLAKLDSMLAEASTERGVSEAVNTATGAAAANTAATLEISRFSRMSAASIMRQFRSNSCSFMLTNDYLHHGL